MSKVGSVEAKINVCAIHQLQSTRPGWLVLQRVAHVRGLELQCFHCLLLGGPQYILQNQASHVTSTAFVFPQAAGHRELCMRM